MTAISQVVDGGWVRHRIARQVGRHCGAAREKPAAEGAEIPTQANSLAADGFQGPHDRSLTAQGGRGSKSGSLALTDEHPRRPGDSPPGHRQPVNVHKAISELPMKTQGEIEATICEGMSRLEQEYMGRGPRDIHAHVIGDLLVVRLLGVLTVAEQQLVKTLPAEKGRDLLKQVRTHLIETARPVLAAMIQEITGVKVVSLHHDISTLTGEEVVLFTLAESPEHRQLKKR